MAAETADDAPAATAPAEGTHNSVLIRTHEPPRESHAWVVPTLLGVAVLGAAVIWGVIATHPAGPVVNHSVADAPTGFATAPG